MWFPNGRNRQYRTLVFQDHLIGFLVPYWCFYWLPRLVCVCVLRSCVLASEFWFSFKANKPYLRFVPKGILARVHDRKLELHKLEIRAEEGGPSITTNITSSSASIGAHTEILLPTKGSCISFCECDQDKTGMIIAVGSSCGVLLYYLPPPPQLKGNDEFMQSCSVIVETVQGSLFSPHTTVAVACGGE